MGFIRICAAVLAAVLALGTPGSAQAQSYPSRPVNVIVPFPAGGSTDWLARMLSQKLEQRLKGASFVVENRPGGANVVAAVSVAKAPPDGHTLLMTTSTTMAINVSVFKNLGLRPGQGFRAGRARLGRAVRAGGQCRPAGEVDRRPGQGGEGEAGRSHLRLDRRRLGRASLHGAAAERARHRGDRRALQGQCAGIAGHHRRACVGDVLRPARRAAAYPQRQAARRSASPRRIARRRRPICRRCRRPA